MKLASIILILTIFNFGSCQYQNLEKENRINSADIEQPILVYDYENILKPNERKEISKIIINYLIKTNKKIIVVTTPSIGDFSDIKTYAVNIGNTYSKYKNEDDIVLIAISVNLKKIAIITTDKSSEVLTDKICENIIQLDTLPFFKNGNYYNGTVKCIEKIILNWNTKVD